MDEEYLEELDERYAPLVDRIERTTGYAVCPRSPICCPSCWWEHVGQWIGTDERDWRRAFPALPWETDVVERPEGCAVFDWLESIGPYGTRRAGR